VTPIEYIELYRAAIGEFKKGYQALRDDARAMVELGKKLDAQLSEAKEKAIDSLVCEETSEVPEEWGDLSSALEEATLPDEYDLKSFLSSLDDFDESEKLTEKLADLEAALEEVLGEGDEEHVELTLPGGKR
jgi:hypothetical protein